MRLRGLPGITILIIISGICSPARPALAETAAATYYVSSSTGSDSNPGTAEGAPLASIGRVNTLDLQPGDRVLFKCGDVWRADPLVLSKSGTISAPITFGSYPAGCADQPSLSGSRPIGGWASQGGSLYAADLSPTDFPLGINQLFRGVQRLTLGRWPNIDAGGGGYAFIDGHTAGGSQISDTALPSVEWTGAVVHLKNIRWSMLDRLVTSSSGQTLNLNSGFSCLVSGWGSCQGWGYFINNSRHTLDQNGEWYYDPAARRVYLVSTGGPPDGIEGSVILSEAADPPDGGIMLSGGLPTAYVVVENLEVKNWFNHGISAPGSMRGEVWHHLTLRGISVRDPNEAGARLSTWIWESNDGVDGFRGGYGLLFSQNLIEGANSFGVTGHFVDSLFEGNTIRDVGLVENLGAGGMGCGYESQECTENGDGFRILTDLPQSTGYGNTLRGNRIERTAYNGVDVFGHDNTLQGNFITLACFVKADCGAVRTFGGDSLTDTSVYNIRLLDNLIVDIPGNVDGVFAGLPAFGMGLYVDHSSRDVETRGNFIIDTTATGILYQSSSGVIADNTIFNASSGTGYSAQVSLSGSSTRVNLDGNTMFGLKTNAWTLYTATLSAVTGSDWNRFFHPYLAKHITYAAYWPPHSLAEWQAASGQDAHSSTLWYSQPEGEESLAQAFYNPNPAGLVIDLGSRQYLDVARNPVTGSLTLAPYSAAILVDNGPAALALTGLYPSLLDVDQATGFTLTVYGAGFSPQSVVRWNGAARPTTFVNSYTLRAAIPPGDTAAVGSYAITVFDPLLGEAGPAWLRVVEEVWPSWLPLMESSPSL